MLICVKNCHKPIHTTCTYNNLNYVCKCTCTLYWYMCTNVKSPKRINYLYHICQERIEKSLLFWFFSIFTWSTGVCLPQVQVPCPTLTLFTRHVTRGICCLISTVVVINTLSTCISYINTDKYTSRILITLWKKLYIVMVS